MLLRPILTVTTICNTGETGDIHILDNTSDSSIVRVRLLIIALFWSTFTLIIVSVSAKNPLSKYSGFVESIHTPNFDFIDLWKTSVIEVKTDFWDQTVYLFLCVKLTEGEQMFVSFISVFNIFVDLRSRNSLLSRWWFHNFS